MVTGAIRVGSFAAQREREQVLTGLFRSHCVELVRLAYVLLGDRQRAEETVQEVYLSLFRHWPPRDHASALAYLRAGVINQCRSDQRRTIRARRGEPHLRASLLWSENASDTATDVVIRDEASRLAELVRALPRRQREVITCRYYLQLSERETAELLEIGIGSVKTHAHRGLAALQTRLEGSR
ncbi:sigma-70 family RNA polymerase sigma factor [Intrasporangium calvum]|uniref:Sigma-70 family RNA polymerase sigma factor n=1 Tax=Intrasporangium calvum TaxID=53358 RepID=A0ABT5GDN4_9MICO|nr:sigma-70 family RNA polymerase sigma factor [Intrasporangium calvum]MDC5696358.1 sigma-70 family RNA polymerase sigma factor [Intrasporangium calvum]